MSLAQTAIDKRTITGFATVLALIGGLATYRNLGQLEDPEFTIKTAVINTAYPGASAEQVELEVTDRIETALQEMPQLDYVESLSRRGMSMITAEIKPSYASSDMPQIWDELRKKVRDVRESFPPGVAAPVVADDFGDVYGLLLAVTADGFDYAELEDYVDGMKKELSLVEGVARVEIWGAQQRCIYIDVSQTRLSQLGISMEMLYNTLTQQNVVVDSGGVDLSGERLLIDQTGEFESPEDIENLIVRSAGIGAAPGGEATGDDELVYVRDIGEVRRGFRDPPRAEMRFDGLPALAISISNVPGANVVELGREVEKRYRELLAELPIGIEVHKISWQSDLVSQSIADFMISLLEAVAIVLAVLWLAMGYRVAAIVGLCGLVFTIVISFLFMGLWGIDLQRMSLGALVIAMGMMVDNAIVVCDGIMVRLQQGMDRVKAAVEAATLPSVPLLGATIIAVMAFFPIYVSPESAGEYCASLFQVVAVSLMLSWVLSVTVTPLMCIWLLPTPENAGGDEDAYAGRFYGGFRSLLAGAIRFRLPVIGGMVVLLAASGFAFRYIDSTFFPDSARLQVMIDYWAPEGTAIETVSEDLREIEAHLQADEKVTGVSAFIGQGPPRFYLPVSPEKPYSSYGQLIVNVKDLAGLNKFIPEIDTWAAENVPQARCIVQRYGLGPSETWKVEARISGPANADPKELRKQAAKGIAALEKSPYLKVARTDWRQRVKKVQPVYDQQRARLSRVSRSDIGKATRRAYDGLPVGLYREEDKLLPIVVRHVEDQRQQFPGAIESLQVHPTFSRETVPMAQVTAGVNLEWEDPLIWRYNRRRTITIQANPPDGVPASKLRQSVLADFDTLTDELPTGYELEWGSEYESSRDSQQSLIPGVLPALAIVALIVVALFNAYRPPLIIACTIPFALIGVSVGLLSTGQPFGFLALLGAMSLAGMMIKNAIVLLDQIDIEKAAGKSNYEAVMEAALSRLRPVVLAAATTVLGVIPLLQDVFWVAMAVTIMFGLAFGTLLTMVLLPVLYACFYRAKPEGDG